MNNIKNKAKLYGKCPICGKRTKGGVMEDQIMFYCTNIKCETLVLPGKLVQEAFRNI